MTILFTRVHCYFEVELMHDFHEIGKFFNLLVVKKMRESETIQKKNRK